MKKKITLLTASLLALSLASCGGNSDSNTSTPPNVIQESASPEAVEINTADAEESAEPKAPEIPFEEITVVDNELASIKLTGLEPDNMWGYTVKALLENKSPDKTYMFSVDASAINGIQVDPLFASEVAPGKKSNEDISFLDSKLSDCGIKDFTDIEISFRVYDTNDWSADNVAEETVHIYPLGEDKITKYSRETQPTDTILLDNDSATVIVTDYDPDSMWGYAANVYIVNKTDKDLSFHADEVSVNGFMADPFWGITVNAGKVAFSSISWSSSELESNNITTVENIELKLRVHDANDWSAEDIFNDTITLTPESE